MTPKMDYQHLSRLYYQLEQIKPQGTFTEPINYKELFAGSRKKELLVFITDLYQSNEEILGFLDAVNTLKHEVIVFHLMSANELSLDFKGYSTFEDLETGQAIQIDQDKARVSYKKNLQLYLEQVRISMLDRGIYYRMLRTDVSLDTALRDFLNQRNKLKV